MQVGSFYEIYDNGNNIPKMEDISNILNLILTRKDKSNKNISDKNCLLIGFPCISLSKYLPKLLENEYITIVIDQKKNGKCIERFVKDIYSPGINLDFDNTENYISSNWLGCIFIEDFLNISVTVLDIYTGDINIHSINTNNQLNTVINTIFKLNDIYNFKELLIVSNKEIDLNLNKVIINKKITKYTIKEINEMLSKIYKSDLLSPIEYINLEKLPECLYSLIEILKYAHEHNENIIKFIKIPNIIHDSNILYLDESCISRLDLHYLIKILNKCITNNAKREFTYRLLFPIQDINIIKMRLDKIEFFKVYTEDTISRLKQLLKQTKDIPLILRKLIINTNINNSPIYLHNLYKTVLSTISIIKLNDKIGIFNNLFNSNKIIKLLENSQIISVFNNHFDFEDSTLYNFIIKNDFTKELYNLLNKLNNMLATNFYLENYNGKWIIICNNNKNIKEYIKNKENIVCTIDSKTYYIKDFTITSNKSTIKLENEHISTIICTIKDYINKFYYNYITNFINTYLIDFRNIFEEVNDFLIEIDISFTNYLNSIKFNYIKPNFNNKHKLIIKDIRHPIIEYLKTDTKYISNSIELSNGILLYGINSIGKSSLIKSIGLNVIMAQAGMYTACSEYNSFIIDKIYTRFPCSDNIINGKSSFVIEIEDIRNILQFSTDKTLILADEICQSTETYSGISIIAATIQSLLNIGCKFIIASHLHELVDIPLIKENPKLQIKHLSITNDNGKIVFDRILKDGPFQSLYGLEICKSLGMSKEFIELTESIRKKLINYSNPFIIKKSRYNQNVFYKDLCQICNKHNAHFHIHHILPQHLADSNGNIGNMHKDSAFNLVTLCEECHHKVHNNKIIIYNYIYSTNGIELNWSNVCD